MHPTRTMSVYNCVVIVQLDGDYRAQVQAHFAVWRHTHIDVCACVAHWHLHINMLYFSPLRPRILLILILDSCFPVSKQTRTTRFSFICWKLTCKKNWHDEQFEKPTQEQSFYWDLNLVISLKIISLNLLLIIRFIETCTDS